MARPGPQTQAKRQREQKKREKRRAKEEKKALRKAQKLAAAEARTANGGEEFEEAFAEPPAEIPDGRPT